MAENSHLTTEPFSYPPIVAWAASIFIMSLMFAATLIVVLTPQHSGNRHCHSSAQQASSVGHDSHVCKTFRPGHLGSR